MVGDIGYEQVHCALAVQLGFRPQPILNTPGKLTWRQVPALAPYRWDNMAEIPLFSDVLDLALQERLEQDMPEDIASVGTSDTIYWVFVLLDLYLPVDYYWFVQILY